MMANIFAHHLISRNHASYARLVSTVSEHVFWLAFFAIDFTYCRQYHGMLECQESGLVWSCGLLPGRSQETWLGIMNLSCSGVQIQSGNIVKRGNPGAEIEQQNRLSLSDGAKSFS
jgi:hypothetical protein